MGIQNHLVADERWEWVNRAIRLAEKNRLKFLLKPLYALEKRLWAPATDMLEDFAKGGIRMSVDLQHFGLPTHLGDRRHPEKSYFLNPDWPRHFKDYAQAFVRTNLDNVQAITLINEPFITCDFSGDGWNEQFPGILLSKTDMPELEKRRLQNRYFIERAMLAGKAATGARHAIEEMMKARPEPEKARRIFLHNDSLEYRRGSDDYNRFKRFLASDLILGHDWLFQADLSSLARRPLAGLKAQIEQNTSTNKTMWDWLLENYVFSRPENEQEAARQDLIQSLSEIRRQHEAFQKQFGKSMRADTVFGIDYYDVCEAGPGITQFDASKYAEEVQAGARRGLASMIHDYWNRYHLPFLHAETNLNRELGQNWCTQQLLDLAQVSKAGIPVLGFNYYSFMDTYGWDIGMTGPVSEAKRVPYGLVNPENYADRSSFTRGTLPELVRALND